MPDVPSEVLYGKVEGFFTTIFADSGDAGFIPDMAPLNGTATLTVDGPSELQWAGTTPKMLTLTKPIVARIENGVLKGPEGAEELWIIATHQPGANPSDFQWKVTFAFDGISPQPSPRVFSLAGGEVKDLTQVSSGIPQTQVQQVLANPDEFVKTVNGVAPDVNGNVVVAGGGEGGTGADPQMRVDAGFIQWKRSTDVTWTNLVALSSLEGADGEDGEEVSLQVASGFIQWKRTSDAAWTNLVAISSITGPSGADGSPVQMRVDAGVVQWKLESAGTWNNIITLSELEGADGADGADGAPSVNVIIGPLDPIPEGTPLNSVIYRRKEA